AGLARRGAPRTRDAGRGGRVQGRGRRAASRGGSRSELMAKPLLQLAKRGERAQVLIAARGLLRANHVVEARDANVEAEELVGLRVRGERLVALAARRPRADVEPTCARGHSERLGGSEAAIVERELDVLRASQPRFELSQRRCEAR